MPKYAFECTECSLQFERNLRIGEHITHDCPSCKEPAPLVISGFGFAFSAGTGATANSGVHDQDYPTADKAVGRSAEQRWEVIRRREAVKKAAREQGGTHALIRRTGDNFIDYEPMSDVGIKARKQLAQETFRRMREAKKG
jgi:putative FmdB family regulatory protein